VLVRSFWRADVELEEWAPRFEIPHRRLVRPEEVLSLLPRAYLPFFRRAVREAGLA
jgi:hypothetical protein